jgi:Asp/Glu/hydantoin racemase
MPAILVINPNTTTSITERVTTHVRATVAPDIELRQASGRFGANYIASEAAYAIAGHAAIDCYAQNASGIDAVLLACFGDPGLFALREIASCPVIGLAEAAMYEASLRASTFGIVTGGTRWGPMLFRLAHALGYESRLTSVRTVSRTGAAIANDPEGAFAELANECDAARQDGAGIVILGGAGLAGIAGRIAERVSVPLIDSVVAGAERAQSLVRSGVWPYDRAPLTTHAPSVGVPEHLAKLLAD